MWIESMKVTSIIWGVLRGSNKEKIIYSRELVKDNITLVKIYQIVLDITNRVGAVLYLR